MDKRWENPARPKIVARLFPVSAAVVFFVGLSGSGHAIQMPAAAASPPAVETVPVASLHPALDEVDAALRQIQIERWKVSRDWKSQFSGDANSIQQDLNGTLPGLLQTAQQSPNALQPQYAVMHNVEALYDVLVRLTTAANLTGGKADAFILGNALEHLEAARKAASMQLMQAALLQDQQVAKFQAQLKAAQSSEAASEHNKTIVVDNRVTHKAKHRKPSPAQTAAPPPQSSTGR